jgi:hypothetical protein
MHILHGKQAGLEPLYLGGEKKKVSKLRVIKIFGNPNQ